jgi:hypothetical protein
MKRAEDDLNEQSGMDMFASAPIPGTLKVVIKQTLMKRDLSD